MSEENKYPEIPIENGVQPIDALMTNLEMANNDVVTACDEQLTHKIVMKARRGRRLSRKMQLKVLKAFNTALNNIDTEQQHKTRAELFNYGY